MRSLRALILLLCAIAAVLALAGCGGKSSSTTTTTTSTNTVVISPSSGSIVRGGTLTLFANVQDANGAAVAGQTFTFKSSNPAIVDLAVTSTGSAIALACGGKWDSETAPVVCTA